MALPFSPKSKKTSRPRVLEMRAKKKGDKVFVGIPSQVEQLDRSKKQLVNRDRSRVVLLEARDRLFEFAEVLDMAIQALDSPLSRVEHGIRFHEEVQRFEIDLIERAMTCSLGSQVRAAKLLGLRKTTLNSKIKTFKINWHREFGGPPKVSLIASGLANSRLSTK